ncbi:MAG: methyl-accepting chemotaxis protein [Bdellovibrionales bacterium]
MNQWSIKKKIIWLCGGLMALILVVGASGLYGGFTLITSLEEVADVQLPAVREMTLVDMQHDGLMGIAYRSIVAAETGDMETKKSVAEDLKGAVGEMNSHLANLEKLRLHPETREKIGASKEAVLTYTAGAEEIVGLALSGQRSEALKRLPEFQSKFNELEIKLGALADSIEKDANEVTEESHVIARRLKIFDVAVQLIGLLTALLLSISFIRSMMRTFGEIVEELKASSRELTGSSSQSSSSATELSEASTEQAASLQETMASVEEISAMVNQNAESSTKAKTAVDENQTVSEEGSKRVSEMIRAIDEIKETNDQILKQMEASNTEFSDIVKIITEIGEKTKVINDIVFQTKLLSFNASVEAARAGEHGKGFAVVAEEVGNLAQMSGNAAREITDMLTSSIDKVNSIVENNGRRVDQLVEVGKDKISMGQSTAQKCKEALDHISKSASTIASMITEVTHASKEQAQGIQEINKAIGQLDQVTQQNASVAQLSSTQAEQLSKEAVNLSRTVEVLVAFAGLHQDDQRRSPSHSPAARATQSKSRDKNVVFLDLDQRKPKASNGSVAHASRVKKVAGSDVVPSGDDPGFEEF